MRPPLRAPVLGLCLVLPLACATPRSQVEPGLLLPPRSPAAATGSQLLPQIRDLSVADREIRLWHELAAGNVPSFLRRLVPVPVQASVGGTLRQGVFWCTPDYLGVGADADWFRLPMTPILAQRLADRLECALPTRRMVDAIWARAPVRLQPFPYSPATYNILSVDLFHQHHLQIEQQRGTRPQDLLVAGIKKDVVASALIATNPGRVVIYGWHQPSGVPIQPLSRVHTDGYADYSHGVRLVAREMEVDGVRTTVEAVLADPQLHVLLSDEGPFGSWRYPVTGGPESFPYRDAFPAGGPQLQSWRSRFTAPQMVATSPPPPGGEGVALRVMDPAGGTDSIRLPGNVADVGVQADLLCEHRPQLAADGFERIGVFVRDRAQGAFVGTNSQAGACYALTWDGHDGRVQCLRVQGGALVDLLPAPVLRPGTAWRRFRLEASGTRLRFLLDGALLLETQDTAHASGEIGIGYREHFTSNGNMRGTRVDSWHADVPGAFALAVTPGPGLGELRVRRLRGIPGDVCFTAFTPAPGAFPNGWFFGIDPTAGELLAQFQSGHPAFLTFLGADGGSEFRAAGLPPGLPLYAVALDLEPGLRWWQPSPAVATVTR